MGEILQNQHCGYLKLAYQSLLLVTHVSIILLIAGYMTR